jgi:hypothetical protein
MPQCCAGSLCKYPEWTLHHSSGHGHGHVHHCPDCGEIVHNLCAIRSDDLAGPDIMDVCPECFNARKPPAKESNTLSTLAFASSGGTPISSESREQSSPMRKKRNSFVCEQFVVVHGSFSTGGTFRCRHCNDQTFVWSTWNASKARSHLEKCNDTPEEMKVAVFESSQASRKKVKIEQAYISGRTRERDQGEEPEGERLGGKKRNSLVCEQYVVLHGAFATGGTFRCMHCNEQTFVWNKWNVSKARGHLEQCCDTPQEVKVAVAESSQASRKKYKMALRTPTSATTGSVSSETEPADMGGPPTLLQQYKEAADAALQECERLKAENVVSEKKLRKCQEKLHITEMFSKHDKTKIENLEKEKAQLEELNRMLKGVSDDDSTSDRGNAQI